MGNLCSLPNQHLLGSGVHDLHSVCCWLSQPDRLCSLYHLSTEYLVYCRLYCLSQLPFSHIQLDRVLRMLVRSADQYVRACHVPNG